MRPGRARGEGGPLAYEGRVGLPEEATFELRPERRGGGSMGRECSQQREPCL